MISNLHDITTTKPKFIGHFIEEIAFVLTEVIAWDDLQDSIKISAVNYLMAFCQANLVKVKNSK